jgi:hypothetical protein
MSEQRAASVFTAEEGLLYPENEMQVHFGKSLPDNTVSRDSRP